MKVIYLIFVLFVSLLSVFAQTGASLSGTVYLDGKPVPEAVVELRPSKEPTKVISTKTDLNGEFRFENLPAETYSIWAEKREPSPKPGLDGASLGGASGSISLKNGQSKTADLTLNFEVYKSESIIREYVSVAADRPQPIDEVSKTVNVIGAQEMRERADFTLVDTLRSIPGFRVQQLGGFGKTANIKTRGLRNQDTAVLIDGVRFRDSTSITGDASPFLSDLTLTSVSGIEVLRGSGSSLYGTNAIGGVIDLKTPASRSGFHGQVSAAAGGLGLGRFRANVSDANKNETAGFNAAVSRTVYTKGIDGDDDANNTNAHGRVDIKPTSKTNISGRLFFSDAFVRLNSNPDTINAPLSNFGILNAREGVNFIPDVDDPDDTQRSRFFNGQIVVDQIISNQLIFNGFYSGLATKRRNETGPLGVGFQSASTSRFDGTINTLNGHIVYARNSINTLTAGYEFERETFGNEGLTPDGGGNFSTDAAQSSNTVYAQDLVSLMNDRLQLAGGVRAQFFSLSDPKFSLASAPYSNISIDAPPAAITFDGAASYFFKQTRTKIRAHVGNGYRVPSLFERFGTFFDNFSVPNAFVALGDPRLKPEKSIAADAGIEQNFEKVKLTAVYFYTKLIDTIGFGNVVSDVGTTPRPFGGYLNQKGGIARGAELSVTAKPTMSTDIFASYTFTNSDQREPQVTGTGVIDTLGIPKHQFTLVATQRIKRFWVNFDLLVASDYLAPIFSNETFNSYVFRFRGNRRGDITAGYTFDLGNDLGLRLFGTAENVFDDRYFENGFRTAGRNGRVGVAFSF
jgi:iron complex outermembrane receptor protein